MTHVLNLLDDYFVKYNKISHSRDYTTEKVVATSLIVSRRIDLIAKIYYIECKLLKRDMTFAKALYLKHIEAFSDGTYSEHGSGTKLTIEAYFSAFDEMIETFKEKGFDETLSVVPVGYDNTILDGSHRVACAAYFKQEITIIRFNDMGVDYGLKFFKRRLLEPKYLYFLAITYAKMSSRAWLFLQQKSGKHAIEKKLAGKAYVLYSQKTLYTLQLKTLLIGLDGDLEFIMNKHIVVHLIEGSTESLIGEGVLIKVNGPDVDSILDHLYESFTHSPVRFKMMKHILLRIARLFRRTYRVMLNHLKRLFKIPV